LGCPDGIHKLNLADRRRLFHFVERKLTIKEMARELGRHRSTIYREIRRNTFHDRELPDYVGYFPTVADDIRKERLQRLRKLVSKSRYNAMIKNQSRRSRPIMDKIIETFSPLPARSGRPPQAPD
jgi:IS30 family transposase